MNKSILTGRLTKDIELRYTPNGTAVANFNLAVNRQFAKESEQQADFIQCQAWSKTAETMANHLSKGSKILVEGRIQTRNFEGNDGKKVYITEVVVERFEFLDYKQNQEQQQSQQSSHNPYGLPGKEIEISDDELPF